MKIGVISSGEICIPLLQFLKSNNLQVFGFSEVEDKSGFAAVAHFCQYAAIPLTIVDSGTQSNELYNWIENVKPDVMFVLGYRHLINIGRLSQSVATNIFNIHFGPLPSFRGPNPLFWQLRAGESSLAVTIHRLTQHFDAGPVVWNKTVLREPHFNYGYAQAVLSQVVIEGIAQILTSIVNKLALPEHPQEKSQSRYHSRPQLKDVSIQWSTMDAYEIINLINACNPWNKGAIALFNGLEVKVIDAVAGAPILQTRAPGTVAGVNDSLQVVCAGNTVLHINMLFIYGSFMPARYAANVGFALGQTFN